MTREEAARVMGVAPREVSRVAVEAHGVTVVMSSGAHRLIGDDGVYATDDHPANGHLRRFHPPETDDGPVAEELDAVIGQLVDDGLVTETPADGVPEGTVEEVLAWIGDDPERALAALDAENARRPTRKSLIKRLEER